MDTNDKMKTENMAEATVMALFRSAVFVYYVDVQHDWFKRVRTSDTINYEANDEGVYSKAQENFAKKYIPSEYIANYQLKTSCQYIRNCLSNTEPEYRIEVPVVSGRHTYWLNVYLTMIDMANGMPHHVVLSARDVTKEHLENERKQRLIDDLRNQITTAGLDDISQQNHELLAQNQELAAFNVEILESRDNYISLANEMQEAFTTVNDKKDVVHKALMHIADFVYFVDVTTGMLVDYSLKDENLKTLGLLFKDTPCNYNSFMQRISHVLSLKGVNYSYSDFETYDHSTGWTTEHLQELFDRGITTAEIEFYNEAGDTYFRLLGLLHEDERTHHILVTAIGTDVTQQRRRELDEQRQLREAREIAEHSAAMLEEKQQELEEKHEQLEQVYNEMRATNNVISGLKAIFNSCYYVDTVADKFIEIKSNDITRRLFSSNGKVRESILNYIRTEILPEHWSKLYAFADMSNIRQATFNMPFLSVEFETVSSGWVRGYIVPTQFNKDGMLTHFLYVSELIDEEKRVQAHLKRVAETDGLTGIANRTYGEYRIREYLQRHHIGAFGILDCDDFKGINDTYGHSVGDKVLIAVANAMNEALGTDALVMRLGGDEFAFYMPNCDNTAIVEYAITRLFTILDTCKIPELGEHRVTISIGAILYEGAVNTSFVDIYKEADKKLYMSKAFKGINKLTI